MLVSGSQDDNTHENVNTHAYSIHSLPVADYVGFLVSHPQYGQLSLLVLYKQRIVS